MPTLEEDLSRNSVNTIARTVASNHSLAAIAAKKAAVTIGTIRLVKKFMTI